MPKAKISPQEERIRQQLELLLRIIYESDNCSVVLEENVMANIKILKI